MFSIGCPILFYSIHPHTTIIGGTKPYQAKPIKFIIKLCINHNILLVKNTTCQKSKSSRAASYSKLGNKVINNSIFNTNCDELSTMSYLQNDRCSFICITFLVHTTTLQSVRKCLLSKFSHPYSVPTCS